MAERKLVSVVTGTYQRHELLLEAIENVRQQTYRPLEHVIVSDGPDPELARIVAHVNQLPAYPACMEDDRPVFEAFMARQVPITFQELGFWSSGLFTDSMSAAPLMVAQLLARGAYQVFLADDERMEPDHIESLVGLLEETGADFGYSQVKMWWNGRPDHSWVIGTDPPQCGQITNVLYRRELLNRGVYPLWQGMTSDWSLYAAWIGAGAKHAFLPRVTFSHRVDH